MLHNFSFHDLRIFGEVLLGKFHDLYIKKLSVEIILFYYAIFIRNNAQLNPSDQTSPVNGIIVCDFKIIAVGCIRFNLFLDIHNPL